MIELIMGRLNDSTLCVFLFELLLAVGSASVAVRTLCMGPSGDLFELIDQSRNLCVNYGGNTAV